MVQLPDQWEEVLMTVMRPGPMKADSRCVNTVPDDDNQMISLHPGSRYHHSEQSKVFQWTESKVDSVSGLRLTTPMLTHQLTPCAQIRGSSQTSLLRARPELHHPTQSAAVLAPQRRPVALHAHRLGEVASKQPRAGR